MMKAVLIIMIERLMCSVEKVLARPCKAYSSPGLGKKKANKGKKKNKIEGSNAPRRAPVSKLNQGRKGGKD
jgi:hypothetical protein